MADRSGDRAAPGPFASATRAVLPWALVPGIVHIRRGHRARGWHLLGFTAANLIVLGWRHDRFPAALGSEDLGEWSAACLLVLAPVAAMAFSLWDASRLQRVPGGSSRGMLGTAARRFRANGLAVASVYVIVFLYWVAALAPLLAPYDPVAIDHVLETRYLAPSWEHPFGTDQFGRDLLSRALFGARVSLSVGLLAMLVAKIVGTGYGAVAAYHGGWLDNALMRVVDVVIAFPTFYLMLMLVGVFEANVLTMALMLGLTAWPGTARFVRGEILSLKEQGFTQAARALGLPARTVIVRHLIPSALSSVLVSAALTAAGMIGAEAGLSFLGLGIRPPTPSWGNMISSGQDALLVAWWTAFFPGTLLAITLVAFSLLADGLRDALDPKSLLQRLV